jgi:hypothetical protein
MKEQSTPLFKKLIIAKDLCIELLSMTLMQCHFDYSCSFWYAGIMYISSFEKQITSNTKQNS